MTWLDLDQPPPGWFVILFVAMVALLIWAGRMAYQHGVWDGTHNPTIPPVKRALEALRRAGWRN